MRRSLCMFVRKTTLGLTISLSLAVCMWAQSSANKGEILGTVLDPNQAVVPSANVKIKNTATGAGRELTTNELGQFRAVLLDPGQYDVTVEKSGFATSNFTSVVVNVGTTVDLPVNLKLGTTTTTVEVGASLLPVDMPGPSSVITTIQVQNLPINGRRFQDFALMTPTVQVDPIRGQLSFVGQRGINANVMVDGADYNQPFFGGIRGGERSNFVPTVPQSSIQEFQVVTDGYTAEYGRSTGGMLNTVTKSGTNEIHGEAFYQLRHKETGLKTPFNKQILETLQQFGGAAGGKIKTDKLFWFGSIERQLSKTPRQILFGTLLAVAPTPANSTALNYFHSLEGPFQSTNDATALTGRGDYQITSGSRLALRYNFSDASAINAAAVGGAADTLTTNALTNNGTEKDRTHTGLAQLTSVLTPNIFNDLRFSYTYELRPRTANSTQPSVTAGPIGSFGTRSFLPTTEDDKRIQITDSVSIVRGAHTLKFGGDYNYASAGQVFGFNQFGTFTFTISDVPTILKILSGNGTNGTNLFDDPSVQYRRQIGSLTADFHMHQIAFYGEDSWRISPKFLLNFGLRWEGQVNGQPEANNTAVIQAVQAEKFPLGVTLDPTKFPSALNQVMPRVGFTYSPTSRTVVRGHAGIFYASTPMLVLAGPENNFRVPAGDLSIALLGSATSTVYQQFLAAGVDLNKFSITNLPVFDVATVSKAAAGSGTAPDPFRGASFTGLANDFRNPRAIQAGLGLDQEVVHNFVVGIQFNYVNTIHLERNHDYNLSPPSVIDASGRPIYTLPRPLPQYSIFTIRESSARSMYRGMTLSSRYHRGRFQFGAFYTASQAYSDDDNERDASGFSYNDPYNLKLDYGYSNLDARHQFSGNAVVSLPFGIDLAAIYHFRSGLPINPATGSDVNKDGSSTGDRALQAPGKLFERNSFRNTAFNDFDLRFLKTFNFGERAKLQFSTEMFNLFNFSNVIIAGRNLNYGLGVDAQGQTVAPNSFFRQLRLPNGQYDPVNTQVGFPFQAQFGLRFMF